MTANDPLSLSAYQQLLGDTLRRNPALHEVWLIAELSDVRVAGGHCYMELIEKEEISGQVLAKMRATIWNSRLGPLQNKFYVGTGSAIRSGLKVMVRGSVNHHNVYGLSFTVNDIDPSYTVGDLERQRREILDRLAREGVIDLNRQLPFPEVPQKIAVISAEGAAGYGDFMDHLLNSPECFVFYPLLVPAVMQGEKTAVSVMEALDFVESTIDFWDCAVIIRGGGSTTDMHGFDNYELARRVAEFPLPVVVGIGHERDRNILDEIACRRCKTPTAVADFLVDCCRHTWSVVSNGVERVARYASDRLHGENMLLANLENLLPLRVNRSVAVAHRKIDEYARDIERICGLRLSMSGNEVEILRLKMINALKVFTERPAMRLWRLEDMLRVLSPENTLRRGYSITRSGGKAVYTASELKEGDTITTIFHRGQIESTVRNVDCSHRAPS